MRLGRNVAIRAPTRNIDRDTRRARHKPGHHAVLTYTLRGTELRPRGRCHRPMAGDGMTMTPARQRTKVPSLRRHSVNAGELRRCPDSRRRDVDRITILPTAFYRALLTPDARTHARSRPQVRPTVPTYRRLR
jgi:hypothetical protein